MAKWVIGDGGTLQRAPHIKQKAQSAAPVRSPNARVWSVDILTPKKIKIKISIYNTAYNKVYKYGTEKRFVFVVLEGGGFVCTPLTTDRQTDR